MQGPPPSATIPGAMGLIAPLLQQQQADQEALRASQAQAAAAAMAMAMAQDPNPLAAAAPSLPGEPSAPPMPQAMQ